MPSAPMHPDETKRLVAVQRLRMMGTPAEERFDRITRLARRMFSVELAIIDLIGERRVWLKSVQGFTGIEAPRREAFCAHTILHGEPCLIEDTRLDPRTADMAGAQAYLFYAGVPLVFEGQPVGVLCIADTAPRKVTGDELDALRDLASLVEHELNVTAISESQMALAVAHEAVLAREGRLRGAADGMKNAFYIFEPVRDESGAIVDFRIADLNATAAWRIKRSVEEARGTLYSTIYPVAWTNGIFDRLVNVITSGETLEDEFEVNSPNINALWVKVSIVPVEGGIAITSEDITARKVAYQELETRALVDVLTRVWNRAAIADIGARELARGQASFLMIDIDHFKRVNDTLGHPAGDEVLRMVSERLRGAIRPGDAVGRYGGEEFLVVLPDCSAADLPAAAERIRAAVAATPVTYDNVEVPVTVSVGGATSGDGSHFFELLVRAADQGLYAAKRGGRDRVVMRAITPSLTFRAVK